MPGSEFTFRADDGETLLARRWLPESSPRAVVQIAHGLSEHSARYARLAAALNAAGYAIMEPLAQKAIDKVLRK